MDRFWETHWWLIIVLAAIAVPIVQAIFEPWRRYLRYRERRDALETLKVYAAQGKEPPADVLDAIGGGAGARWRRRGRRAAAAAADAAIGAAQYGAAWQADDRWERRAARWRAREPLQRWNWAIFATAVAAGFGYASQHVQTGAETYFVIAIIAGALAVAGVISALISTFWRID